MQARRAVVDVVEERIWEIFPLNRCRSMAMQRYVYIHGLHKLTQKADVSLGFNSANPTGFARSLKAVFAAVFLVTLGAC